MLIKYKPYNLTYFIMLFAVATFAEHKSYPFNRKRYKMFYIGMFYNENLYDIKSVKLHAYSTQST